jgi:hypothetical protein
MSLIITNTVLSSRNVLIDWNNDQKLWMSLGEAAQVGATADYWIASGWVEDAMAKTPPQASAVGLRRTHPITSAWLIRLACRKSCGTGHLWRTQWVCHHIRRVLMFRCLACAAPLFTPCWPLRGGRHDPRLRHLPSRVGPPQSHPLLCRVQAHRPQRRPGRRDMVADSRRSGFWISDRGRIRDRHRRIVTPDRSHRTSARSTRPCPPPTWR